MKTFYSKFNLIITLVLIVNMFSNFSCNKNDTASNNNGSNNNLPDENTPYVEYYAIADGVGLSNPKFMVATGYGPLALHLTGDTTTLNFDFTNNKLTNDAEHTNIWTLCSETYDETGHDDFHAFSQWTGGNEGKLEVGKTYNFSYFTTNSGKLSIDASEGVSKFYHYNHSNTLVATYDSYGGGNSVNTSESYIKIEKIENGTASGTFKFGFTTTCARDNGFPYADNITGKFNKIPIN